MNNRLWLPIILGLILAGCATNKTCDSKSIILDENDFSIPVVADSVMSPLASSPRNSAGGDFVIKHNGQNDPALQIVEKYTFRRQASTAFESQKDQIFRTDEEHGPWEPLDVRNLSTSQYFSACGLVQPFSSTTCRFIAQYDRYLVYFAADIADNGMTREVFMNSILEIDSKVSACLAR